MTRQSQIPGTYFPMFTKPQTQADSFRQIYYGNEDYFRYFR